MRGDSRSLPLTRDHRDMALEHQAADDAALLDYCAELLHDNESLRLEVSVLLEQLGASLEREKRLRETVARQTELLRAHVEARAPRRAA